MMIVEIDLVESLTVWHGILRLYGTARYRLAKSCHRERKTPHTTLCCRYVRLPCVHEMPSSYACGIHVQYSAVR